MICTTDIKNGQEKALVVIYWQNAYSAIVTNNKRYDSLNLFNDTREDFFVDASMKMSSIL